MDYILKKLIHSRYRPCAPSLPVEDSGYKDAFEIKKKKG